MISKELPLHLSCIQRVQCILILHLLFGLASSSLMAVQYKNTGKKDLKSTLILLNSSVHALATTTDRSNISF